MTRPAAGMRCVDDPGARIFAVHAWTFLDRDPIRNNVLCTSVEAACAEERPDWRWVRVLADGELVGVAMRTPPRGPLLSDLPEPAARALAAHFAGTDAVVPSVGGPEAATTAFADHYAGLTGAEPRRGSAMRLFRLDRVAAPAGVPGHSRPATLADRGRILAWLDAFFAETLPAEVRDERGEREAALDRRFAQGHLMWFWEVAGIPVSFAWRSPLAARTRWPRTSVVRVSAVYTPPEQRGHGYASANVAAVSQRGLDAGARACMLYTDAANPTSNKIYQQIGYRLVCTAQEWRFR
jgi:predicted GNAT family acetyltransferase